MKTTQRFQEAFKAQKSKKVEHIEWKKLSEHKNPQSSESGISLITAHEGTVMFALKLHSSNSTNSTNDKRR